MARDDVVAQEFGKDAVWNFFVVPALLVEVLILEHLGEVRRPVHQDVPLGTEKEFHGTMRPERLFNILAKQVWLVDILDEGYEGDPEGDSGYVGWVLWWQEEDVID